MTGECDQTHRAGLITALPSVRGDECVAFLWTSCPLCPHRGCKRSPVEAGALPSQVPCGIDVGCGGADGPKTCLQRRIDQRQKSRGKKERLAQERGIQCWTEEEEEASEGPQRLLSFPFLLSSSGSFSLVHLFSFVSHPRSLSI